MKNIYYFTEDFTLSKDATLHLLSMKSSEIEILKIDGNMYFEKEHFLFQFSQDVEEKFLLVEETRDDYFDMDWHLKGKKLVNIKYIDGGKLIMDCFLSQILRTEEGFIYVNECQGFYKIGITTDMEARKSCYKTDNPFEITNRGLIKVNGYKEIEEKLHKFFSEKIHRGEWFNLTKTDLDLISTCLTGLKTMTMETEFNDLEHGTDKIRDYKYEKRMELNKISFPNFG